MLRTAAWLGVGVAVVIAAAMLLFGKAIVACFVSGDTAQVQDRQYWVSVFVHHVLGATGAVSFAPVPFGPQWRHRGRYEFSGFFELFMRVLAGLTLPNWLGEVGIFYAEPLAWIGAVIVLAPVLYHHIHDLRMQYPNT